MDLKKGEGRGNVRSASLANAQLADLPTLIRPLVEQGLKAEIQIWGNHLNSRQR